MGKVEIKIDDFVGFLPSGYISRSAVEIVLNASTNKVAYLEYSPTLPMTQRVNICDNMHKFAARHILALVKGGYVEDLILKYGSIHWQTFRALRLTKAGLHLLTGTIDPETENGRIDTCIKFGNTKRQAMNYLRYSDDESDILDVFKQLTSAKPIASAEQEEVYKQILYDIITDHIATPLASFGEKVSDVAIVVHGYTGHRLYKQWRLANIEALFRCNGFLTRLDRRPLDRWWLDKIRNADADFTNVYVKEVDEKRGIIDEDENIYNTESTEEACETKIPLQSFVDQCMHDWYESHPHYYYFDRPYYQLHGEEVETWKTTPAFYPAYEIPGFGAKLQLGTSMVATGATNTLRYNFVGVAIGKVCNYLIYHTRPTKTNWCESIERTSAYAVQRAIDLSNEAEPVHGAGKSIENAIMVCSSVHQFAALFTVSRQKMPKRWRKIKRVGAPFDGVNIVTLNNSGAMLLRGLMLTTPVQFEEALINSFIQRFPKFRKSNDVQYQLTYEDTPVLMAHSMDFQRLYYAWEDYRDGQKFLVSCYPEQVKYIQKIMPNVEFL